jgi:hypothetical protein
MDEECSTYGGDEKNTKVLVRRVRDHLEDTSVDGRIKLQLFSSYNLKL